MSESVAVDKALFALLNGLAKRIYFKETEFSDEFLRNDVLGGISEEGAHYSEFCWVALSRNILSPRTKYFKIFGPPRQNILVNPIKCSVPLWNDWSTHLVCYTWLFNDYSCLTLLMGKGSMHLLSRHLKRCHRNLSCLLNEYFSMLYKNSLSLSSDRAFLVLSEPIRIMASHLDRTQWHHLREQPLFLSQDQYATLHLAFMAYFPLGPLDLLLLACPYFLLELFWTSSWTLLASSCWESQTELGWPFLYSQITHQEPSQ